MTRQPAEDGSGGTVLAGRYRLEELLGEGGMAAVWRAYDLEREMPVALKLVRGEAATTLAQRLEREARAAARVEHPAIVRVLDAAVAENGVTFLVMELLQGETLAALLARGRISAVRAVQLLLPIIDGLALAHAQGVVHRDLKPSNVFLDITGPGLQPRLVDFGIAKLTDGAPRLTGGGQALGSPSYMSPEQARGEDVDFRSDIWSMCVLLYRAIGGNVPFKGADTRGILNSILRDAPPLLPLGAGVDQHLSRIIMSGLNKEPLARPASMRKLGEQLAGWLLLHGVAVDACGAALTPQWLSSDEPPPLSERTAAVTRKLVVAKPAARFISPRNRWILWAVAGVLVAGASLALSNSASQPESVALQPTRLPSEGPVPHAPSPQVDAMLTTVDTAEVAAAQSPSATLATPHASSSNAAPARRSPLRSNGAPTPRRPALPF
jgi:serine/threonine-protein kinase